MTPPRRPRPHPPEPPSGPPTSAPPSSAAPARPDKPAMKTRRAPRGRSFSSRNPTVIGAIGLVVIGALLWASFNASKLPIIGGGTVYSAQFSEAAGLRADDEVRIAGVKVGTVSSVGLEGDHVRVKFRVKHAFIGNQSTLAIKIKTLLGAKYLAIDSVGDVKQKAKDEIGPPCTTGVVNAACRTTSPYDIYPAFQQLTKTVGDIDTKQLGRAFETLAATFENTPESVREVIVGLSRLSHTVASRDAQLASLLSKAKNVTQVLVDRDDAITKLLSDGNLLLNELTIRRDAIHALLQNTSLLSAQLEGLVSDNQATLKPALDELHGVLKLLQDNQDSLDRGLAILAPFYRVFANTLGNGRWFDTYIQNLSIPGVLGILGVGTS
jgi:phospholipid/cholesterol/gamma-HCH transport system substrate-binding protein